MRIANSADRGSPPPPPYTEAADASRTASQPVHASLRGGYMRPSLLSDQPPQVGNLLSATTYFENRDHPDVRRAGAYLDLVEHTIQVNAETIRDDLAFPLPIEASVARDVTNLDWSTFVNFLFPMHDEDRNEKDRPQKIPQRLSFVGKDTPARRDRISAVVAEWNENFFNPRQIHIDVDFPSLPSYFSPQSTGIPSAAQEPHVGSRPLSSAGSTMYDDLHTQWSGDQSAPVPVYRSLSASSSLSSGPSSSSSVDSIKSNDLEGADLGRIRSTLLSFQLDATKKDHLRASVRQLRDELRSQRQDRSGKDTKELRKEYKNQRKETKKEIKAVVKEAKASLKADRKIRKAERKSQRERKRAERRGKNRIQDYQDKGRRAEERAAEKVRRAQEKGREVEERASEMAARAHERAREAQAQGTHRDQEVMARTDATDRRAREAAGRAGYGVAGEQETGVLLREVTRSHKQNDRDHAGLADGTAEESQHLPRYFAKSGHVDADPKKVKKEGGGKGNWGTPGDESQDYDYNFTNARRRSNSSSHGRAIGDFKTKFEAVEADPVFEEEYHGAKDDAGVDEQFGLEKGDSTDSISSGSIEEEEHAKKV